MDSNTRIRDFRLSLAEQFTRLSALGGVGVRACCVCGSACTSLESYFSSSHRNRTTDAVASRLLQFSEETFALVAAPSYDGGEHVSAAGRLDAIEHLLVSMRELPEHYPFPGAV